MSGNGMPPGFPGMLPPGLGKSVSHMNEGTLSGLLTGPLFPWDWQMQHL